MQTFIITFDPQKSDYDALHNVIKTSAYISDWWHYLGPVYIVTSTHSLSVIHHDIHKRWPNGQFLIIEVTKTNRNGFLPKEAWGWFNK